MFRVTVRGLLAHRVRLGLTALAIALGVAFMSGSFVFSATLTRSLDALFGKASAGTDVVVQHAVPGGGTSGALGAAAQPVPALVLSRVRGVPGVLAADGEVSGRAVLLGRSGRPLPARFGVALSWPGDAPFQSVFTARAGLPPAGPGQVMIDRASASAGGFRAGDRIEIAIAGRAMPFTVSGITGYGSATSIGGGSLAIFDLATAQRLFGKAGTFDQIAVRAAPGVTAAALRDRVAAALPAGVVAVTAATAAANQAQQLNSQLSVLTDFFLVFAGIALVVGALVIWNTFSIVVSQRTRELALLRALGAGRGQVSGSVLAEALAVGCAASAAGAALGIALARGLAFVLSSFGVSLPSAGLAVPLSGILIGFGAGVVVTVLSSAPPACRATRVAPVQAMRLAAVADSSRFAIARLAVSPLAAVVGGLLRPLPGRVGVLAHGNATRNPRRTGATAAALMIGLAVITATAVLVGSARADVGRQITAASRASFYVQAVNSDSGLTPLLAQRLARVPGVTGVTPVQLTDATVGGAAHRNVSGVDPATIGRFTSLGVVSGSLSALSRGGMLVSSGVASASGWHLGSVVVAQFGAYGSYRLPVAGIFTNTGPLTGYLVSSATFRADTGIRTDNVDLVRAPASALPGLRAALAGYPGASLLDQAGYIKGQTAMLNSLLNVITALLVLAIVIALLGVVNTLALSISERTREIGVLRAIGMPRGQVRATVAAESVIVAVIGAVWGTAVGVGLGAALTTVVAGSAVVVVPGGQLAAYVLATAAAGVLASVPPARRAARLDMLAAIAAE